MNLVVAMKNVRLLIIFKIMIYILASIEYPKCKVSRKKSDHIQIILHTIMGSDNIYASNAIGLKVPLFVWCVRSFYF